MITVYRWKIDQYPEALDPDVMFGQVRLSGDDVERRMIEEIERGQYLDNVSFIDRFGFKVPRQFMSMGCKTAIAVHHFQNRVINCIEAGVNAIGRILLYCPDAHIILPDVAGGFGCSKAASTKVQYGPYVFENAAYFSKYMEKDWPDEPEEGFAYV